jgi:hypothetical protein
VEYAAKRESNRLGALRLEMLPTGAWQKWDRERLARTGGSLEQYKHPCLISDLKFRGKEKERKGVRLCFESSCNVLLGFGLTGTALIKSNLTLLFLSPRFIRSDDLGVLDRLLDFLVSGLKLAGGPQHDPGRGAWLDGEAVGFLEEVGDLAIGHPGALVEIDNTGLGIRSDLALGGAGGIGGLQGMATADASAAAPARALVDAELSPHRLGGDVGLELFVDLSILGDFAATMRTRIGEGSFKDFVDRSGRWPMSVLAMLCACFAPRFLGLAL